MEEKRLLFVYNPNAGKGHILTKLGEVIAIFAKAGYRVEVYPTKAPQDATRKLEESAKEFDVIVCSGGDGTLGEVVTGLVNAGAKCPLGYIPVGTTNDFASSLQIPQNVVQAASAIVSGTPHPFDVGRFNKDIFVYVAAFGIFTEVSYETDQNMKKLFGHMAYLLEGVKRLGDIRYYWMKVDIDGAQYEDNFIYGMVTNSNSIGGFKNLTGKNVELDDGFFEVTFIKKPKNLMEMQEIISSLVLGEDKTELIISGKAERVIIEAVEDVPWTLDGEFGGNQAFVRIENQKHGVEIIQDSEPDEIPSELF